VIWPRLQTLTVLISSANRFPPSRAARRSRSSAAGASFSLRFVKSRTRASCEDFYPSGRGFQLVAGGPEVGDEHAMEQLDEEVFQNRRAPGAMDEIAAQAVVGEAPQPVGDAVDTPAGLIGVQASKSKDLFEDNP